MAAQTSSQQLERLKFQEEMARMKQQQRATVDFSRPPQPAPSVLSTPLTTVPPAQLPSAATEPLDRERLGKERLEIDAARRALEAERKEFDAQVQRERQKRLSEATFGVKTDKVTELEGKLRKVETDKEMLLAVLQNVGKVQDDHERVRVDLEKVIAQLQMENSSMKQRLDESERNSAEFSVINNTLTKHNEMLMKELNDAVARHQQLQRELMPFKQSSLEWQRRFEEVEARNGRRSPRRSSPHRARSPSPARDGSTRSPARRPPSAPGASDAQSRARSDRSPSPRRAHHRPSPPPAVSAGAGAAAVVSPSGANARFPVLRHTQVTALAARVEESTRRASLARARERSLSPGRRRRGGDNTVHFAEPERTEAGPPTGVASEQVAGDAGAAESEERPGYGEGFEEPAPAEQPSGPARISEALARSEVAPGAARWKDALRPENGARGDTDKAERASAASAGAPRDGDGFRRPAPPVPPREEPRTLRDLARTWGDADSAGGGCSDVCLEDIPGYPHHANGAATSAPSAVQQGPPATLRDQRSLGYDDQDDVRDQGDALPEGEEEEESLSSSRGSMSRFVPPDANDPRFSFALRHGPPTPTPGQQGSARKKPGMADGKLGRLGKMPAMLWWQQADSLRVASGGRR